MCSICRDGQSQSQRDKTGGIWAAARPNTDSEYQRAQTHCPHLTLLLVMALATVSHALCCFFIELKEIQPQWELIYAISNEHQKSQIV